MDGCESRAALPIQSAMLWFSNRPGAPTAFVGFHLAQEQGAYVLRVLHPDGSQETQIFADRDACIDHAMTLREELIECGWRPCSDPIDHWAH